MFDNDKELKDKKVFECPYCKGNDFIRKGLRAKKYENVQVYLCKNCNKRFTPLLSKNKSYPLRVILEAVTHYNRFYTLEGVSKEINDKYNLTLNNQTILNWLDYYKEYLPFLRMREFIDKKYPQKEIMVETRMFHGQIYGFKYHRAKLESILDESFKHYKFRPLQEFLELAFAECPHQIFKDSKLRASEYKEVFNLDQVRITSRPNTACKVAGLVLQAVADNKLRHETLQEFFIVNDSVTVSTEIPVLLDRDDILHYKNELGFEVPLSLQEDEIITGHIDILQVRNGSIHIIDYKPGANKVKPVDQLTIYAMALSRLTTIRLFHFKCAWFDENDYFEFFPLHVVYKKKKKGSKKRAIAVEKV
jgi:hypothetical protein